MSFEKRINLVDKKLNQVTELVEKIKKFLYPYELEEYNRIDAEEDRVGIANLSPDDYKKIIFYRFLGEGFNREFAEELSTLQAKRHFGGSQTAEEEKREQFLRCYQSLVVDNAEKGFTINDVNEWYALMLKEEITEKLEDKELEKLLFYRFVTDFENEYSKEEALRRAKLQVMDKYNLLSDHEKNELDTFYKNDL